MGREKLLTRDTLLILLTGFFYMACSMLVTPLITGFSESIGAGKTMMGFVGGGMNLCSLFCRPFMGNLADRISKYKLSLIGASILIASSLGYAVVTNTALLFLLRIFNGIGFSLCSVCATTWMSELLPPNRIGEGMGFYGTMNALAMAAAPAIGVALMERYGYRIAFIMAAVFGVCTLITILLIHDKGLPKSEKSLRNSFKVIDVHVVPMTFTVMCFAIPYCATQSFLVNYIGARSIDVPVGLFFPVYAGFLLVLRFALKKLFDRVSFIKFFSIANGSALLSMLCLYKMQHAGILILAAFFMAGGYGIMCTVCQSKAILLAGEGRKGLANSTYYVGLDLGMTLGPILGGVVFGGVPAELFYPCFMILVPLCIASYLLSNKICNGTFIK